MVPVALIAPGPLVPAWGLGAGAHRGHLRFAAGRGEAARDETILAGAAIPMTASIITSATPVATAFASAERLV